jgi:hypothetical protein
MRQSSNGPARRRRHARGAIGIAAAVLACAIVSAGADSVAAAGSDREQCRVAQDSCRYRGAWARYLPSPRALRADDLSSARRRPANRVRIVVRRSIFTEPGAVYGYPPGNYVVGAYGILYGPYPIRPVRLVYPPAF